jgi:ABC-type multidrug transport system fused ATPase/permease subunit
VTDRVSIVHATAFGFGITLVKSKEMTFENVFRVFSVVTFAAMSVGRSASMVPNYSKGKASAIRIFALQKRQSAIDPQDPSGIKLVTFLSIQSSIIDCCSSR